MKRSRVGVASSLVVLLLVLAGCGTAPAAGKGQLSRTRSEPDVAYYQRMVVDLAAPEMEGRGPGTAGITKARDYIVAEFKRIGLAPAFGESFTQSFEIALGTRATTQTLAYATGARRHAAKPIADFQALGTFRGKAEFLGNAVFVGYGMANPDSKDDSYRDLPADALKGKVAIAFRYEPMTGEGVSKATRHPGGWSRHASLARKAALAARHGAVALLVVDPPTRPLSGSLRHAGNTANDAGATIPVMHVSHALIESMLKQAGHDAPATFARWQQAADDGAIIEPLHGVAFAGEVAIESYKAMTDNIAAVLPGRGALADEIVVVGAHYDHVGYGEIGSRSGTYEIHFGADDNASGTAGVILLAQRYAKRFADDDADRRTILFTLFTAEERGLIGSAYMMDHLEDLGIKEDQIVAMFNMDMIGRSSDNKFNVFGTGTGDRFAELIRQANEEVGFELATRPNLPPNSDHMHFSSRSIPTMHFFSGFHADYHKPSDTAEKINFIDAVRGLQLLDLVMQPIVTEPARVAWRGGEADTGDPHVALPEVPSSPTGSSARLGIMPDYNTAQGQDGAGVGDVLAEPARSAGLEPGDVIIQWNDRTIANVEQLSAMLNSSDPGDKVRLIIKRDGERKEIELVLGSR